MATQPRKILLIEDNPGDARLIQELLAARNDGQFVLEKASRLSEGLERLKKGDINVLLLDLGLPDSQGLDTLYKARLHAPKLCIIVLTGNDDISLAMKAIREGAQDYLVKGQIESGLVDRVKGQIDSSLLVRSINYAYERKVIQDALQESEARLRLILEQLPCLSWVTDIDLRITSLQGAALETVGLKPENIVGKTTSENIEKHRNWSYIAEAHRQALKGEKQNFEVKWHGRVFYAYVEPTHDAAGNISGVIGVAFDITDRIQAEEERRQISRQLVETQEKERRAIGRELHDQTGQYITALKLLLSKIQHEVPANLATTVGEALTITNEMMAQVRELSLNLRPPMLDDLGLAAALMWQFDRYTNQMGVHVNFKHQGLDKRFAPEINTAVYRITQEALTNIARYAATNEAQVQIIADDRVIRLRIEDKGAGFDINKVPEGHNGLRGMRERVMLIGGHLKIQSAPGEGTLIIAEIPLE